MMDAPDHAFSVRPGEHASLGANARLGRDDVAGIETMEGE
jgi:hypothetical protein